MRSAADNRVMQDLGEEIKYWLDSCLATARMRSFAMIGVADIRHTCFLTSLVPLCGRKHRGYLLDLTGLHVARGVMCLFY